MIGFGGWEFSPMDLTNPFPFRCTYGRVTKIAKRLPWIKYHEIAGSGHLFPFVQGMVETIVRELLLGEK